VPALRTPGAQSVAAARTPDQRPAVAPAAVQSIMHDIANSDASNAARRPSAPAHAADPSRRSGVIRSIARRGASSGRTGSGLVDLPLRPGQCQPVLEWLHHDQRSRSYNAPAAPAAAAELHRKDSRADWHHRVRGHGGGAEGQAEIGPEPAAPASPMRFSGQRAISPARTRAHQRGCHLRANGVRLLACRARC
jgi:hypothetical protein